jgi:hypothetical protein
MKRRSTHYYVYVNGARVLETRSRARAESAVAELRAIHTPRFCDLPGSYRVYMTDHIGMEGQT